MMGTSNAEYAAKKRSQMSKPQASLISDEQAKHNRSTQHQWRMYQSHRQQIEHLIVPMRRAEDRICVLGAGNCNDLDLAWLAQAYREVHLVDIDPAAIDEAAKRQGGQGRVQR